MKHSLLLALAALALGTPAVAQNFGGTDRVIPFTVRTTLPGVCAPGQAAVRSDQGAGFNVYVCGSANNMTLIGLPAPVVLTDAATITTDAAQGTLYRVTLAGNRTLAAPTNPTDGQRSTWEFIQDATGSRTITLNAAFAFGSDITGATLTTTASKRDFLTAVYNAAAGKWYVVNFVKGY